MLPRRYSYCNYTVLILYSYCTHTVLILYSYCTHTVLILYLHSYPPLHPLTLPPHPLLSLSSHHPLRTRILPKRFLRSSSVYSRATESSNAGCKRAFGWVLHPPLC
jgi:hypothetical protein